jgi:hypothetical protein
MSIFAGWRVPAWNGVEEEVSWEGEEGTTNRRRDKRASPVEHQAIEMTCVLACRSVGARAALQAFANDFNAVFGTVRRLALGKVQP